jgi:AAA+ superfamily predicted ATPase
MDGVEELVGVTVIGATNRPEVLVSGIYAQYFAKLRGNPPSF